MSILNWKANSSSNFASFFIVMTHNFPVNFKLIHFQLQTKGCHQSAISETFKCSGENLSNSSCHCWKYKSVFLQILYQSSVSSNITPLHLLSSNIVYFGQKQPIKKQIFEIFECSGQKVVSFLISILNDKSILHQSLHHSSLS